MHRLVGLLTLLLPAFVYAQTSYKLPIELSEISGLEKWNDSTLIAINDGGNKPILYVLNLSGQIIREITVNATNVDWEAMASDENYLYIGDFGNNMNERKDLCLYRIAKQDLVKDSLVNAEKMSFRYQEQTNFPPSEKQRYFDAEAMTFFEGQLWIFTKNSTKPFDGISYLYTVQFEANANKTIKKTAEIKLNKTSYLKDAITSACTVGNHIVLSTYNRLILMTFPKEGIHMENLYYYPHIQQVEACVYLGQNQYFLSNEKNKYLGPAKFIKLTLP